MRRVAGGAAPPPGAHTPHETFPHRFAAEELQILLRGAGLEIKKFAPSVIVGARGAQHTPAWLAVCVVAGLERAASPQL